MEAHTCDVNHLDADVLLPPRKRLLAGLKKQCSGCDCKARLSPCPSSPPPPPPPALAPLSCSFPDDLNFRLNNLLRSHQNPNLSPEEIMEASRSAAVVAKKTAEAARAAAEEKAAIASKAVAAAKTALDLVASISEEAIGKERNHKKNKLKKHVPVQLLYRKNQPVENSNSKTDEELARRLHQAINSSPRISRNSPSSDMKSHKQKRPKSLPNLESGRDSDSGTPMEQNIFSTCNGHAKIDEVGSRGSIRKAMTQKEDKKTFTYEEGGQFGKNTGEAEVNRSKEKSLDDACNSSNKRAKVKLKKLPLSNCSFRDKATNKEGMTSGSSPLTEINAGNPTVAKIPLFSLAASDDDVMPIEASSSAWKCQELKNSPLCVKQNKVVQS